MPKVTRFAVSKLWHTDDDEELSPEQERSRATQRAAAAQELSQSTCQLTKTIVQWESDMLARSLDSPTEAQKDAQKEKAASGDILSMFLGTFSALLPALPRVRDDDNAGGMGLSAMHFRASEPKYAFARPGDAEPGDKAAASTEDHAARATWESINETTASLRTNLAELAFDHHRAASAEDPQSSRHVIISLGGFLLSCQLLARGLHNASLGIPSPDVWHQDLAEALLEKSLPILMAGLGARLPPTVSASGGAALGGAGALADAALLWLMWSCDALRRGSSPRILSETVSLPVIQLLATHAALSAIPSARHISVRLLRDLMVKHIQESTAIAELRDLILETTYPPLKAACVGLLKDVLDAKIEIDPESTLWSESAFAEWLPAILIPNELPLPPHGTDRSFEVACSAAFNALEEKTSWLSEVSHFLFYVAKRDKSDRVSATGLESACFRSGADAPSSLQTGLHSKDTTTRIRTSFIEPTTAFVDQWQAALADRHPVAQTEEDIRVPLMIIRVALERLNESLTA